jgi:hypothetical protein
MQDETGHSTGGTPPAHLPRWLFLKVLTYRIQAAALGGLVTRPAEASRRSEASRSGKVRTLTRRLRLDLDAPWKFDASTRGRASFQSGALFGSGQTSKARSGGRHFDLRPGAKDGDSLGQEAVAMDLRLPKREDPSGAA